MAMIITYTLLTVLITLAIMALVRWEIRLRRNFFEANASDIDINRIVIYSGTVQRVPNQIISFRLYGLDAELLVSSEVRLNNMGFFSTNDYAIERKLANEFRIVVLGGEQSASSASSRSWPDFLEEKLSYLDPDKRFKVYNFGWPDAGPEHFIKYWLEEAKNFKPDLVIVNYVESDFYRPLKGAKHTYRGRNVLPGVQLRYRFGPDEDDVAIVYVYKTVGASVPTSLCDPDVIAPRPYGFFASREFMDDRQRILALQRRVVREMIEGAKADIGLYMTHSLRQQHSAPPKVSRLRNFDPPLKQEIDREMLVNFGLKKFRWMRENIPNLLIAHNFHFGELNMEWEFTEEMVKRDPSIQVVDMRKRISSNLTTEEIKSWYMIPHMGEKWSLKGHDAYAGMMATLVLEWHSNNNGRVK